MITEKLRLVYEEYEYQLGVYNKLIADITKHFSYWVKDRGYIRDSTKAEIIAHLFQGRSGYHNDTPQRDKNYCKVKNSFVQTDLLVFSLAIQDRFENYITHKIAQIDSITPNYFDKTVIKKRWLERLNTWTDSKIETSLDEYTKYVETLRGFDLLKEFKVDYETINLPQFDIKDWVFIEKKR